MFDLNLPKYKTKIIEKDGKPTIFDDLRRCYVALTPEEWVRQHVIAWLVSHRGIPALRISQEYPVKVNSLNQRADIVVMNEFAKPHILVECKAPDVKIDDEVAMQAVRYNAVVKANYIMLTNGKQAYCYEHFNGQYRPTKEIL